MYNPHANTGKDLAGCGWNAPLGFTLQLCKGLLAGEIQGLANTLGMVMTCWGSEDRGFCFVGPIM